MTTSRDPVLAYTHQARVSGARWGIPPAVLLGLIHVESGGNPNAISSAGARGLTQFMPATANSYGVQDGDPASQIDGAAHYLHDLGYAKDPTRALASYNAGPANPDAAGNYPQLVLTAATRYGTTTTRPTSTAAARDTSPGSPQDASPTPTSNDPLASHSTSALHALLTIALVAAGATLTYLGIARAAGIQHPIRTPTRLATTAALHA